MEESILIRIANPDDINGIIKLQAENQASQDGTLSGELTFVQIQEMMTDMPQIVAVIDNEIVGFLMTPSKTVNKKSKVPIVDTMSASYEGVSDSYIYGPICVNQNQRRKGLAQLMFQELLALEPNREGILCVKSHNIASLKAHEKMGMHKVSSFHFNKSNFLVFPFLFPQ
jgi:ribosomal protein S18 acetylase RimI-like enzyme